MAAGRARVLLAVAALLLTAASVWWFGAREGWWSEPGERGLVERADPRPLDAARPTADTRPQLIGTALPTAEPWERGFALVEVPVSIAAEGPGSAEGGTIVEAGEDWSTLREVGVMSFGETRALTVRSSVRAWRAKPFGRASRFYEEGTARHAPQKGPLTLRLTRGYVSVHVSAVDAEGGPVAALDVELVGSARPEVVLQGTTDEGGNVRWEGLIAATADDPACCVRRRVSPFQAGPTKSWQVSWGGDRSHGTVMLRVYRDRILRGRLVGPGARLFRSVDFEGDMSASPSETWRAPVSMTAEFALPIPEGLKSIRAKLDRTHTLTKGGPAQVVFVVPQTFPPDESEPIEVQTVLGVHVEGVVRDRSGNPVRHAVLDVRVRPADREARKRSHPGWFDEHVTAGCTDDQGRFRTAPFLPGLWFFWVQGEDESSIEIHDAIEVTGPGHTTVVLTLPEARR